MQSPKEIFIYVKFLQLEFLVYSNTFLELSKMQPNISKKTIEKYTVNLHSTMQ